MIEYDDFNKVSPVRQTRVPEDRKERNPLLTEKGFSNFLRLKEHKNAPLWNFETGDRIEKEDLPEFETFSEALLTSRNPQACSPSPEIIECIREQRYYVLAFQKQIPNDSFDIVANWHDIPTLSREDISARIETLVPLNADLSRLIAYDTSGTTGHALNVPTHPLVLAKVLAMVEYVLKRYGIRPHFSPTMTACLNTGAQVNTVVFPNVLSVWNEAAFAKINFHPLSWRTPDDAQRFITNTAPLFLTGDPVGFEEMMRWGVNVDVQALLSTALTMPEPLKKQLEEYYSCPAIDWYSVTETGPIGYMCPHNTGFHILPHDIYIEIVDEKGHPVPPGHKGEITVTGGRNPYVPLLRYRTGDWAEMDYTPCLCGDSMPRIINLEGRKPVLFFASNNSVVNPVDIGRLLRGVAYVQYRLIQRADKSCDLTFRTIPGAPKPDHHAIKEKFRLLFGDKIDLRIHTDPELGEKLASRKIDVYESELYRKE